MTTEKKLLERKEAEVGEWINVSEEVNPLAMYGGLTMNVGQSDLQYNLSPLDMGLSSDNSTLFDESLVSWNPPPNFPLSEMPDIERRTPNITTADDTLDSIRSSILSTWKASPRIPDPIYSNDRDESLVHTAARRNDVATLQMLFDHGASLDDRDGHACTPLHVAVEDGNCEAIMWLLETGADVNAVDDRGRTILSMAVNNGCPTAVKLFLAHGASPVLARKQNGMNSSNAVPAGGAAPAAAIQPPCV